MHTLKPPLTEESIRRSVRSFAGQVGRTRSSMGAAEMAQKIHSRHPGSNVFNIYTVVNDELRAMNRRWLRRAAR